MTDLILRNVNKLFVLSFKTGENEPTRNSFEKHSAGNLLDYLYNQDCCKLIGIYLSRQTNASIP